MYGYCGTWSKSEIWDKQKAHDKCQTVSPSSQVKTQESSFWSGILKWAFKTKICWLKYNRNKRVCNQIPSFFKRSFQVWFFLTGLGSVQWFSVPFWAVSNTIWVGCIESTDKSLFTCSVEVLPVSVHTHLLLPCSCSALQLLRTGWCQERHQFPGIQRGPPCARSICQIRQASIFPSCTPFQQNRACKTEQTASKDLKQLHNPSLHPSLTLSP